MTYSRDDYYQEAFETAMAEEGLWHLVEQMTKEQRRNIGGALAASNECESMAFHTPENPLIDLNRKLESKLKWSSELEACDKCRGRGRIVYNARSWSVNTECYVCHGVGKVHPYGEREPQS